MTWSWFIPLGFHREELPSRRSKVLRGGDFPEGRGATPAGGKTVGASGGGRDGGVAVELEGAARSEDGHGGGEEDTVVGERGGGRDGGIEDSGRRVLTAGGRGGGREGGS